VKLLLLGGTRFLGRAIVEAALARGHTLTLFHRGRTGASLFPGVERLQGDRDGGLDALRGGAWDAVVDTCGFVPRVVRDSARLLADRAGHYTFISSLSVYSVPARPGADESAPLARLANPAEEPMSAENYGALKALCERTVEEALPGRALHVRPGLIVGPHDTTDRFPYWPRRVAGGGEVLAPGRSEAPVQFVDARDLAAWVVRMVESRATGAFNATGPAAPLTLGGFLEACRAATGSDARFTWVSEAFLLERGVEPWSEMPLWVPEANAGFATVDCRRAIAAGLCFRPLERTLCDTLAWDRANPRAAPAAGGAFGMRASLSPDREAELLSAWRRR